MIKKRFFIVGCQRTGTTLMRLVLECHSKVFCLDEERAYLVLAGRGIDLPIGKEIVGFKIPRWTEQLRDPTITDYGMALATAQFYSGEPIVFMLRDVRDVVVSMLRLRQGAGTWLETWGIPTVEFKIATSESFRLRFAPEIEQIRSAKSAVLLTYAALYWKYKTLALYDYLSERLPVLPVRYEDLVSTPERELMRVIEFLQLNWEPQILEHPRLVHGELDTEGKTIGGTNPKRPIDRTSVLQWKNALLLDEIDAIMAIAGEVNERVYGQSEYADTEARTVVQPLASESQESMLRAHLSDREQSVRALGMQLAERDQKVQLLITQVVERQQAVESLGAQLATQTDKVNTLVSQVVERQQAVDSLAVQLATQTDKVNALQDQIANRQEGVDSLAVQLVTQTDKVNTLQTQIANRQQAVESLSAQLAAQTDKMNSLVAQVAERQQAVESVSAQLTESHQKVQDLVAQAVERQHKVERLISESSEREQTLQSIVAQLAERQQVVDLLTAQMSESHQKVQSLVAQVVERQQAVESVSAQLSESHQNVQSLTVQLAESQQETRALTTELTDKERAIQTLSELVGEKQLAIQGLTAQLQDSEQLALQLNAIYSSKLWKLGIAYRAIYEPLRAQFRRLAKSRPRQWLAAVRAREMAEGSSSPPAIPIEIVATRQLDVLCFSAWDWDSRQLASRQVLTQFARDEHRIFYLSPQFGGTRARTQVRLLSERTYGLTLPGKGDISKGNLTRATQDKSLNELRAFIRKQNIAEAVCWVQHPFWEPLVRELKARYGWKIVYECTDDYSKSIQERENQLVHASDLIVTTAQAEFQRLHQSHANCLCVSNNGDTTEQPSREESYRVIRSNIEKLYSKASIIIVTWNNIDLTRQCIASVLADKTWPNFEIVVVDNASNDGTVEYLRTLAEKEPCVKAIFNEKNAGFAAANNTGIQNSRDCEYVILLNNDTVLPRGWLARLLRHARKPEIGLVGPVTNWTGNEAKIKVTYRNLNGMEPFATLYAAEHEGEEFDVGVLAMFCVAVRKSVVDQVGLLDERFQVGMFEDDDYARRVRQAGYRVICGEDVFVHHQGSASFRKLSAEEYQGIFELNKRLYEDKWGEPWKAYKNRAQLAEEGEVTNSK